jgi:1-deoxy-D-xylulose-5-phosphate synthase
MIVMAPSDENECRQMLYTGFKIDAPVAVRYPRGSGPGVAIEKGMHALPLGKGEIRRRGEKTAILSFGALLKPCLDAGEKLNATVANMRFVKPLDEDLIRELAQGHTHLVTVEENTVLGGAGSGVLEILEKLGVQKKVLQLGLPDRFVDHGDPAKLLTECGLDAEGIRQSIAKFIAE